MRKTELQLRKERRQLEDDKQALELTVRRTLSELGADEELVKEFHLGLLAVQAAAKSGDGPGKVGDEVARPVSHQPLAQAIKVKQADRAGNEVTASA